MHNQKYVVCFSKSAVKTVTLYGLAYQPLCYPCSVAKSTMAALLGCTVQDAVHTALHHFRDQKYSLTSLIEIALNNNKIAFLLFLGYVGLQFPFSDETIQYLDLFSTAFLFHMLLGERNKYIS